MNPNCQTHQQSYKSKLKYYKQRCENQDEVIKLLITAGNTALDACDNYEQYVKGYIGESF